MKNTKKKATSRKKASSAKQDLFSTIKKDHRLVEGLFSKIEKAREPEGCMGYYEELRTELTNHADIEEKVLYPRLKEKDPTRSIAFESIEEHDVVRRLCDKIDGLEVENEEWEAAVMVLREVVEHHVKEEEGEMFTKMRKVFSKDEREMIREEYIQCKEGLMAALKRMVA